MSRADNSTRRPRTSATGAAIVAATEVGVEAAAAAIARKAEAVTPPTAAGAAIVAAAEVAGEVAAGEAMATTERVAEAIAPADPVPVAPEPSTPVSTPDMSNPLDPTGNIAGHEESIDLLSGEFTAEDVAASLRRAQQVDPGHVDLLRSALAILDAETATRSTPGLDNLFGKTVSRAAAPVDHVRRFRLVSPIINDDGGVPAGEWITADRDYHATLRRGLSVDVDWDGGLPL